MTLRNNMAVNTKLGFLNCFFQGPGPFQFLTKPLNSCARRNVINFIGGCHHLRVETGRWYAVPRPQRVCLFCPVACVEDETHSILYCESFSTLREDLMREVRRCFPRLRIPVAGQYQMEDEEDERQFLRIIFLQSNDNRVTKKLVCLINQIVTKRRGSAKDWLNPRWREPNLANVILALIIVVLHKTLGYGPTVCPWLLFIFVYSFCWTAAGSLISIVSFDHTWCLWHLNLKS